MCACPSSPLYSSYILSNIPTSNTQPHLHSHFPIYQMPTNRSCCSNPMGGARPCRTSNSRCTAAKPVAAPADTLQPRRRYAQSGNNCTVLTRNSVASQAIKFVPLLLSNNWIWLFLCIAIAVDEARSTKAKW